MKAKSGQPISGIGNIINKELIDLFDKNFETVIRLFDTYDLIELDNDQIIGHEK